MADSPKLLDNGAMLLEGRAPTALACSSSHLHPFLLPPPRWYPQLLPLKHLELSFPASTTVSKSVLHSLLHSFNQHFPNTSYQ